MSTLYEEQEEICGNSNASNMMYHENISFVASLEHRTPDHINLMDGCLVQNGLFRKH
jgi:hypothetical protein